MLEDMFRLYIHTYVGHVNTYIHFPLGILARLYVRYLVELSYGNKSLDNERIPVAFLLRR